MRHQEGMAGVHELQLRAHHGRGGVHVTGQEGHGLCRIQLPEHVRRALEVARVLAHARGQVLEDANDLPPLFVLQGDDVVVQLDRGQRLHEEARPRTRAAVDDARDLAAVLGLEEKHVAVVAGGDELVLQEAVRLLAAQERLHHARELGPEESEGPPGLRQLGRSIVRHLPRGKDRPPDGRPHRGQVLDLRGQAREAGHAPLHAHHARDLPSSLDEGGHIHQCGRGEVEARHPGRGQDLREVGEVVIGLPADRFQEGDRLGGHGQGVADGVGLGLGLQGLDFVLTRG